MQQVEGDISDVSIPYNSKPRCAGGNLQEESSGKSLDVSLYHESKGYFLALNDLSAGLESRKFWDGRGERTLPVHVSHSKTSDN